MAPEVGIAPLGRRDEIVWGQIFRFGSFIGARQQLLSKIASALTRFVFDFFVRKKTELEFITPIHEQRDAFGDISKVLGIPLNYLQDGFLPGNFSSCYLKYIHNPACFLVWDRASSGIFIKHGLPWRCSLLFADTRLPLVQRDPGPIKKILYLASGAGDWTAVKNRSDEDRAFETFIEVARRLPEVQVVFRPHPLWADPNMQGLESLERIANYVSQLGIPNFHMSGGALSDSKGFKRDKQVSRKSSSIQGEIADAEVVFGDHSQTMIIAARQGKIMASVNVSRRESLFSSFSYYGFPCLQTADDVINFILSLGNSSAAIAAYNLAVAGYNQSGAGPTH
jgi:hypothetical protein